MAATAQGDEADHAGHLRRGLPRDLGGVALCDFDALGVVDRLRDFVRNRFGNGLCFARKRGRSRVLDDGLRADTVPSRHRIEAGRLLDGAEPVLDGQSVRLQSLIRPPLLPDNATQERDSADQAGLHHGEQVNQHHGDRLTVKGRTVFRRQAGKPVRQHLPRSESSACSSSLVSRAPVRAKVGARLWQGRRETDGLFFRLFELKGTLFSARYIFNRFFMFRGYLSS